MSNLNHLQTDYSSNFLIRPLHLRIPTLRLFLWVLLILVNFFVVIPSLYLFVWSLWGSEIVGVLNGVASFQWYSSFFQSSAWFSAFSYSLILAILVSLFSCFILSTHFYFMRYSSPTIDRISYSMTTLPVMIPAVIFALSLKYVGARLSLPEFLLLFTGHLVFIIPIQFFILESAQETIPTNLLYAGNTLGSSHLRNIVTNYIPLLSKALRAAFLVGFFYSFDELVIATFIIDTNHVTIPKKLWDEVPRSMEPNPAIVASILLIIYLWINLMSLGFKVIKKILNRNG